MATNEDLKKIAQKSIEDDDFRIALEINPEKAAASIGITLSPDQIESITQNTANAEEAGSRESKGIINLLSSVIM